MEWRPKPLDIPSAQYWQSRLSCQGCQLPLTPPVFYCQSSTAIHPLCNYCTQCSNCQGKIGRSLNRCIIIEKILAVSKFRCQYQCKAHQDLSPSEYRVHVRRCHLRPIQCILCNEKIPFRSYFEHLRDYHKISKKMPESFQFGNFSFYDFESQPSIQYNHTGDKIIFFRYENSRFWVEILSEEEDAEMDYYSSFEITGPVKNLEGKLKFLNARASHEGTIPSNPETYNHRISVTSQHSTAAGGLKNFVRIPPMAELHLWIICEDDNSISSIGSFESEWDDNMESSDKFQNYISKLVDDMADLLHKKRGSVANFDVPPKLMSQLSIPEEYENFETDSSVTPMNSPFVSYKTTGADEEPVVLDPVVVEKNKERREHILLEIITTERNYVKDMGEILQGYGEETTESDPELFDLLPPQLLKYTTQANMSPGDYGFALQLSFKQLLLGNLDEIYEFQSKEFLPMLEDAINTSIEAVGACFLQTHSQFLTLYSRYCQMLPAVAAVRRDIGEDHPWMETCRQKLKHRLSLDAYTMKPVQRITKYHLLLKDLMKYSEDCPGYSVLYEALSQMLEVLRSVDERMMQRNIVDYPYLLEEEGPMQLQAPFLLWTDANRRSSGHPRHLFLYARSILICKRDRVGTNDGALHFKLKINLTDIGITEKPKGVDPGVMALTFELWTPRRANVYLLQAETPEVRDIWVATIKAILMDQFKTAPNAAARRHSGLSRNSSFSSVGSSFA